VKLTKESLQISQPSEEIREHYRIEKELAARLRNAGKTERMHLYAELYDELFRRVRRHPQLIQKADHERQTMAVSQQLTLLNGFLRPEFTFLEIGPGDCALSFEVAKRVRKVFAIDVSEEITKTSDPAPDNFTLHLSDGCSIAVPPGSIDVAYSNQLMEHLHPDDVLDHLRNVHRSLKHNGTYICITPNRLSGPYDISCFFDRISTGFHLKEYTASELEALFRAAGFRKIGILVGDKTNRQMLLHIFPVRVIESILTKLPPVICKYISMHAPVSIFREIRIVANK
jgi:SAM-dependent methyltransferase